MLTLSLTRHLHARKELYFDRTLRIVSRSGLNPTERLLLEQLPALQAKAGSCVNPLFLGGRTGALAMALWLRGGASGRFTLHTFDAHTAGVLERNLRENSAPLVKPGAENTTAFAVSTTLDLTAHPGDIAFWQMTRGDVPAELHLMMFEQLASARGVKHFLIAAEELNDTFLKRFKKVCTRVVLRKEGELSLLSGDVQNPYDPADLPAHTAVFSVSLPGHEPIELKTLPGCFCHRRADNGGLALTEVVAQQVAFEHGDRIMDMGCGCGMDGLLLATAFPEHNLQIDYQDSHAAARESTLSNLNAYPHAARFLYSAAGEGDENSYDLFLANPPYFGDWRIAEFFVETAARLLKRGGILAFVSKRETKPLELIQAAKLQPLDTFSRRGYTVILAQK